jgi:sulfur-carrier protein
MQVRVYATLRDLVGAPIIEARIAEPTDVGALLQQISASHPELGAKLWDAEGALSRTIQVLVNGRSIQFLKGLETPVCPEDSVSLFPPVGGG